MPFDWVSFCCMLLHKRWGEPLVRVERRQLWVGADDPAVLVLLSPGAYALGARFRGAAPTAAALLRALNGGGKHEGNRCAVV